MGAGQPTPDTSNNGIGDYALTADPIQITCPQGGSGGTSVTVTPQSGFEGTVALEVSDLPANVDSRFSQPVVTLADAVAIQSGLQVYVDGDVPTGDYPFTITGRSGSITHTVTVTLKVITAFMQYSVTMLQPLPGPGQVFAYPTSINEAGEVVGYSSQAFNSEKKAVLWQPDGTVTQLIALP